jgi:hypothetical protein
MQRARFRLKLVVLITLCSILAMDRSESLANLYRFVDTHKNTKVSKDSIAKLSQYDHLIRYFCGFYYFDSRQRVSPDFVRALIVAESGVDPLAVSVDQAIGLGQIQLATGIRAGKELSSLNRKFRYVPSKTLANITTESLKDPAVNIFLTCYLIAKYNYQFSGRLDLVVSAWNAGENTSSLKEGKHAPYPETENLIAKVNSYYLYFRKNSIFNQTEITVTQYLFMLIYSIFRVNNHLQTINRAGGFKSFEALAPVVEPLLVRPFSFLFYRRLSDRVVLNGRTG